MRVGGVGIMGSFKHRRPCVLDCSALACCSRIRLLSVESRSHSGFHASALFSRVHISHLFNFYPISHTVKGRIYPERNKGLRHKEKEAPAAVRSIAVVVGIRFIILFL